MRAGKCACCGLDFVTRHPRQKTCLREECRREQRRRTVQAGNRRWRQNNPERRREFDYGRRRRVQEWLSAVKLERGCVDCGYDAHPAALDFDHVRGAKHVNLSDCQTFQAAERELKKCVVRCANCHRVATYERRRVAG